MNSGQLQASTESTTDLALRYLDAAWNRLDLGAIDELASANLYVYYPLMPEATTDRESFKQVLQTIKAGMPDLHFDLRHVVANGNTSVISWEPPANTAAIYSALLRQAEQCDGPGSRLWRCPRGESPKSGARRTA
ncbi:MAG: hypothetical protein JWR62_2529 [Modestobacter sp.]|jgi:hypothetical protein|nr:hypothetical protein [Modestobacter sp.]